MTSRFLSFLFFVVILSACTPTVRAPGPDAYTPLLSQNAFLTSDGEPLRLHTWEPVEGPVKTIIVALHGFNDYGNFFEDAGNFLAARGVKTYAYDQRGFANSSIRGFWPGSQAYADDLLSFVSLVQKRHPKLPLYILGESMGGAIVILAMSKKDAPQVDGVILSAPAVWGNTLLELTQKTALWFFAHSFPAVKLTGQDLGVTPSDNDDMLRALGRDPLIIRNTRIDTIYGLGKLMGEALDRAPSISAPTLVLYGERDEIIRRQPTFKMLRRLLKKPIGTHHTALYAEGYHMLMRDLQSEVVWRDIASWMSDPDAALPSKADAQAALSLK
jgi:acylglycerol lipase